MEQVPYTEVARRGPGLPRLWALELGLQLNTAAVEGAGLTPALAAMLVRELGALELAAGVSGGYSSFTGRALTISQYEGWAAVAGRHRVPLQLLLPYVGIAAAAGVMHQGLTRAQETAPRKPVQASQAPASASFAVRRCVARTRHGVLSEAQV